MWFGALRCLMNVCMYVYIHRNLQSCSFVVTKISIAHYTSFRYSTY